MRCTLLLTLGTCLLAGERAPMTVSFHDSAPYRWLNKKVLESHLLDDMKTLDTWAPFTKDGIPPGGCPRSRLSNSAIRLE